MARTLRTRQRSWLVPAGKSTGQWIIPQNKTQTATNRENCEDFVGRPISDGSFTVSRSDRSNYKGFKGTNIGIHPNKVVYDNYWFDYQVYGAMGHLVTGSPSSAGLGATVRARTNPSRPTIVPMTLVQDLYDLPRMLRDVGKLIRTPRRLLSPREQANQYLGAKFGWLPLIDDVHKLINVGEYINARVGELNRLYSAQGLKRRIRLGRNHASSSSVVTLASELGMNPNPTGRISQDTQEELWGTVRWKPTNVPPGYRPTDAEILQLAKRAVSGFTTEGVIKGAWDVLPWTWMVDWFTNIGDWLVSSSSTIPASPSSVCIMRSKTTVYQHQIISKPQWLIDNGGVGIFSTKSRTIDNGSLAASLPTLDANRLSILGALFVQRFKR